METRRCRFCEETYPIERIVYGPGGKRELCDDPYCMELRRFAYTSAYLAIFSLFWPVPLIAIAIIVVSLFWVHGWWLFIPLALWVGWQFRKGPAIVQRDFDNMPEETDARLDRLRWLREIRRELWRAETVITPGLAEFFSGLRELEDLNPRDQEAVLKADNAYRKRARAAREERVSDLFNNVSDGGGMVCD